ncbi:MAG: hypothetical protein M3068_04890 [Gemmatimonadota bacterium]|nr:hypothetical protein [Gemmatimonadota bacterium]
MRQLSLRIPAVVGASVALACVSARDRIDLPTVAIVGVTDTVVDRRLLLFVRVAAADGSGLLGVHARATSSYGNSSTGIDLGEVRRFDETLLLELSDTVPAGASVALEATAIDNQNFTVFADTTIVVRARP